MIEEYFESIKAYLQSLSLSQSPEVDYDRRDKETGFIKGDLFFKGGSRLHFREFVHVKRRKPVNRYIDADGTLVFRYDDAKHFPRLSTAPHHKHVGENDVIAADAPDLQSVVKEIEGLIGA